MWTYSQSKGTLSRNGSLVATGYSGHAQGKNNPLMQAVRSTGPIPQGRWRFVTFLFDYPPHGKSILRIDPCEGTKTFGRAGFLMHGDMADPALRGTASLGCIIMPKDVRESVWASGDRDLEVVE